MIGIVVVSHSPRLAQAAVDFALEMVRGSKPAIAIAAGAGEGVTGTDAVKVADAIAQVSGPDGVLVMMDLGSAVLSAEMALEFTTDPRVEVRLTSAPFVEGLLAAVVRAAGGASLDEVDREARGALASKQDQLGAVEGDALETASAVAVPAAAMVGDDIVALDLDVINPIGLHIRPASQIAEALTPFVATVTLANVRTGKPAVRAASPTSILTLGARLGDRVHLTASGPQAAEAAAAVRVLFEDGFGEMSGAPVPVPVPAAATAAEAVSGAEVPGVAVAAAGVAPFTARRQGGPIGVSAGVAYGPVLRMPEPLREPPPSALLDTSERAAAVQRIADAAASVRAKLDEHAAGLRGTPHDIVSATALMASDPMIVEDSSAVVLETGESPERAVWLTLSAIAGTFAEQGGRLAERVSDLNDVRNRIVASLLGRPAPGIPETNEPFVLVARDLAPADTAMLDPRQCRAIVTVEGGPTSHTAILARALGLPAVVAARDALDIPEGTIVLVDGTVGTVVRDPTPELLATVTAPATERLTFDGVGRTSDGHRVELLANIGSPSGVTDAVAARAEGVGLFRTEFCFLDRNEAPTVDEQVTAYRAVLAGFPDKKVVVRTLDAGADKPLAFVRADHEENPALGIRGIRTSWRRPDLLDDQLAAIAIAARAERAHVQVMAPMISTVQEAEDFSARCAVHGLAVSGAMIETPAAAVTAEGILSQVEFASLGTNDLAQYTMAADRLVGELADLNDPWQPAVLRLVRAACAGGEVARKPVGVCGEAAADPLLAVVLVGLGVSSLSMAARALAPVAAQLTAVSFDTCREAGRLAVDAASPADARAAVTGLLTP